MPEAGGPGSPTTLDTPRDGLPAVVQSPDALAAAITALRAGTGPVALDTERASGYRYSQRAYLVQIRREGSGTVLIDPIECPDLFDVQSAIGDVEWVLHAASQDLACLDELGLRPRALFDTEVAGRLLGYERVSLGTMLEMHLGVLLAKEHSAADWSTRPLPESWLRYAALDVELLIELRDIMAALLSQAGKLDWAHQEFDAIRRAPAPPPRTDPWRRVSGLHAVPGARALAEVRSLWEARDRVARTRDIAPGRILNDSAIINAVLKQPQTRGELLALPVYSGPRMKRSIDTWWKAIESARALPESALPPAVPPRGDGPPQGRWNDRDPEAALRLAAARIVLAELAASHSVQVELLLEPALVRRIAWHHPADVEAYAGQAGARPWQMDLAVPALGDAMRNAEAIVEAAKPPPVIDDSVA